MADGLWLCRKTFDVLPLIIVAGIPVQLLKNCFAKCEMSLLSGNVSTPQLATVLRMIASLLSLDEQKVLLTGLLAEENRHLVALIVIPSMLVRCISSVEFSDEFWRATLAACQNDTAEEEQEKAYALQALTALVNTTTSTDNNNNGGGGVSSAILSRISGSGELSVAVAAAVLRAVAAATGFDSSCCCSLHVDNLFMALQQPICSAAAAKAALKELCSMLVCPRSVGNWRELLATAVTRRISAFLQKGDGTVAGNYCAALAGLLSPLPQPIVSDLVKIAFKAICSKVAVAECSPWCVECLVAGAKADPTIASLLVTTPQTMVSLATISSAAPLMATRAGALEVLQAIASTESVKPSSAPSRKAVVAARSKMLNLTARALDDKKRVVRRAAAACREQWFLLPDG